MSAPISHIPSIGWVAQPIEARSPRSITNLRVLGGWSLYFFIIRWLLNHHGLHRTQRALCLNSISISRSSSLINVLDLAQLLRGHLSDTFYIHELFAVLIVLGHVWLSVIAINLLWVASAFTRLHLERAEKLVSMLRWSVIVLSIRELPLVQDWTNRVGWLLSADARLWE